MKKRVTTGTQRPKRMDIGDNIDLPLTITI